MLLFYCEAPLSFHELMSRSKALWATVSARLEVTFWYRSVVWIFSCPIKALSSSSPINPTRSVAKVWRRSCRRIPASSGTGRVSLIGVKPRYVSKGERWRQKQCSVLCSGILSKEIDNVFSGLSSEIELQHFYRLVIPACRPRC